GIERPGGGPDPVLFGNPRTRPVLHALQLGEQGPEQLELPWIAHLAVGPQSLDLRQEEVLGIRLSRQIVEPAMPRHQLRIILGQAVDASLQLDQPPDREAVEMVLRLGTLEMKERGLVLAAV